MNSHLTPVNVGPVGGGGVGGSGLERISALEKAGWLI